MVTLDEIVKRMAEYRPLVKFLMHVQKRPGGIALKMAWERLELLRRCRILFADIAAGFGLPPTGRFDLLVFCLGP